jgi:hypothetical protein
MPACTCLPEIASRLEGTERAADGTGRRNALDKLDERRIAGVGQDVVMRDRIGIGRLKIGDG